MYYVVHAHLYTYNNMNMHTHVHVHVVTCCTYSTYTAAVSRHNHRRPCRRRARATPTAMANQRHRLTLTRPRPVSVSCPFTSCVTSYLLHAVSNMTALLLYVLAVRLRPTVYCTDQRRPAFTARLYRLASSSSSSSSSSAASSACDPRAIRRTWPSSPRPVPERPPQHGRCGHRRSPSCA